MNITILTLFPECFENFLKFSIIKRSLEKQLVNIQIVDFRKFSSDKHQKVDDYQCGGGAGMVISIEPIAKAIKQYKKPKTKVYLLTPQAPVWNQTYAKQLSQIDDLILICGHYEGFDERIENYIDGRISLGDFILTGGEIPAMAVIESIVRLIPGVISNESLSSESFENNLLDYDVYTRPVEFEGHCVPKVLLEGNHKLIEEYRFKTKVAKTKKYRPDLYKKFIRTKK